MTGETTFGPGGALVIGGSGGIGSAICLAFAQAGSAVGLTYRQNLSQAETTCATLRELGVTADAYQLDLKARDSVHDVVARAAEALGGLHTLVFVAGAMPTQTYISQLDESDLDEAMEVEAKGFFRAVQAALPFLRESQGSVVHLGSAGAVAWPARDGLSVIPKAANEAIVRGIAREEGRFGVRANSVLIGVIDAGMFRKFSGAGVFGEDWVAATLDRICLKRIGHADDVANAVIFLASRRAGYVTGQQISVSGGYGV